MSRNELNRRDFNRLTTAALGGVLAGVTVGCAKADDKTNPSTAAAPASDTKAEGGDKAAADAPKVDMLATEKHVCRGLNVCKGKGKGGDNECAGKGSCALAAPHGCHAENQCKGQGGCGNEPGLNACKAKGACAVPLGKTAWKKARAHFEAEMKKAGKSFGDAPPPPAAG
jgi:hypothetical protein